MVRFIIYAFYSSLPLALESSLPLLLDASPVALSRCCRQAGSMTEAIV